MADANEVRETRAENREGRQQERKTAAARSRGGEAEPPDDSEADSDETRREDEHSDAPRECHRRGCNEPATFAVLERYQEETGHGAVEAEAFLCRDHTAEESPVNLDAAYADYVFRVEPIRKPSETNAS